MSIPKELLESIPEDENILYFSNKLINKRVSKLRKAAFIILTVGLFVGFYSLILSLLIPDWIEGDFGVFDIMMLTIPFVVLMLIPFILRTMINSSRKDTYLLLTNKNIYIYVYNYEGKSQFVEQINYKSIVGLEYYKKILNDKGDFGNLKIILENKQNNSGFVRSPEDDIYTPIYDLKNISYFSEFQRLFESILYEFGGFDENWFELNEELNLTLPKEFNVSGEQLDEIERRCKKLVYYGIGIPLICFTVLLLVIFGVNSGIELLLDSGFSIVYFLVIVMAPIIGVGGLLGPLFERRKMKNRSSPIYSTLILQEDKIIYKKHNLNEEINLNERIIINPIKIYKPEHRGIKWGYNTDGFLIKPSYNSDQEIIFGPNENFSNNYSFLFHYFIIWKNKEGLLIKKEVLLENQLKREEIIPKESEHRIAYSQIEPIKKKEFIFKPQVPSELIFRLFKNYLNPEEKILFTYKTSINMKKNAILLLISVCIFAFLIYLIITEAMDSILATIFISLALVIPLLCCMGQICTLLSKNQEKSMIFVFSTEKILVKRPKNFVITPYKNIDSIGKSKTRFQRKNYDISLNLNDPTDSGGYTITIPEVPDENPLIEKIRYLKESLSEIEEIKQSKR